MAHVLINGAAPNSTLLFTTEGNIVLSKQLVRASDASTTVDVPITVESQPNIYVAVVSVWKDAVYQGSKNLKVPAVERRLKIEITPAKQQFVPGESASYKISAKDWSRQASAG